METRHLSAILFSDISGYTSLMGENEEKAFVLLEKSRRIHRLLVKSFHGKIIDEIGDGTFACFNSAVDAVQCAIELIQTFKNDKDLQLHIGVHMAEVLFSRDKVYGDGVNLASRIQSSAAPGEILVSEDIYHNIRNHSGIETEFLGDKSFKNVKKNIGIYRLKVSGSYEPITQPSEIIAEAFKSNGLKKTDGKSRAFRIAVASFVLVAAMALIYFHSRRTPPEHIEKSIAVLPFKNLSGDKNYDYFSDGMTEEVINYLSKISDLKVMSRTSVEQYKNSNKDTPSIAKELGVSNVLEGSVRKDSNKVRITVQLIQARTGFHLWSDEYDRNLAGVIKVQSDIAKEVAVVLTAVFTEKEKMMLETPLKVSLTAYDYYMQAKRERMNFLMGYGNPALTRTVTLYHKTLELDSNFAPAYAGLGWAYSQKQGYEQYLSENYLDSTKIYAEKALTLDDNCDEAYNLMGYYYIQHGNPDEALLEYNKALEANPNNPDALWNKADLLCYTKRNFVEGIKLCLKSIHLNHGPDFARLLNYLGSVYMEIGIFDKAEQLFLQSASLTNDSMNYFYARALLARANGNYREALDIMNNICNKDSSSYWCVDQRAWCTTLLGNYKQALDIWMNSNNPEVHLNNEHRIGYLLYKLGKQEEAQKYFNKQIGHCEASLRLGREYSQSFRAQYDLAAVYAFLGNKDEAYKNLKLVSEQIIPPFWLITLIREDPLFDSIRNEEHFQQILKTMENNYNGERARVLGITMEENHVIS